MKGEEDKRQKKYIKKIVSLCEKEGERDWAFIKRLKNQKTNRLSVFWETPTSARNAEMNCNFLVMFGESEIK